MKWNNNISLQLSFRSASAAFLLTLATSATAAPGELSDVPLYTRGSAEPNIMFVLDSSGSMEEPVFPPSQYDKDASYASCSSPLPNEDRRGRDYEVEFRIRDGGINEGVVEFRLENYDSGDEWRTWDSTDDCFDDGENYRAWIYADGNSNDRMYYTSDSDSGKYREGSVSGHYLNWFFSEENESGEYVAAKFLDADGNASRAKVDIRRTDVMKTAAIDLVSDLKDVRVGLMEFNAGAGTGRMLAGLSSIEDSRADVVQSIKDIRASGATPLALSYASVGRYFVSGYESRPLSIEGATPTGSELFNREPTWNGVAEPGGSVDNDAIQYYCQKSFMVGLTDGEPNENDSILSSILKDYDDTCGAAGGHSCTRSEVDDVVKALYDTDLRPDLKQPDGTPVKNNITSYMIGFALDSTVLSNAGALGGGGVYSADNAAELKVTFNQIISKVHAVVGSSSSVAFNSTSLEADSALYAAKFDSGDWSGELAALEIDSDGEISATPAWEASRILDSTDPGERLLLTYKNGTGGVLFTTTGLDFTGTDGNTELDLRINTSSGVAIEDGLAADRVDYLRGDRSNEGKATDEFRERGSRLGDIVNSTPVYVGESTASWENRDFPEASSYAAFKTASANRTPMVYVGANDGFLHGFNASTSGSNAGKEVIGYMPSVLASTEEELGLHALTSQTYLHKFYVDGTPTVGDAYIGGAWKTVLVGGLGGGGKGYFALDVTNPSAFGTSTVMWEFTDSSNQNLGYTYSRPQIGRMSNGKWAAIFGNGYNSHTGDAGVFIVYLDGSGHEYLSTSTGSENNKNGMSTPAIVDSDLNGTIDRIYAGDLRGNMWAFDVETTGAWSVENSAGTATPLFSIPGQPITGAPLVARNTANESGASPNVIVTFGTGQYLTDTDTADTAAGGFYAVSDNGTYGLTTSNLEPRTIGTKLITQATGGVQSHRTLSGNELDWDNKSGWYIPLLSGTTPDGGERVVTRPDLLRNVLFFNTLIPTGQVCAAGGYGWLMSVDIRTGLAPTDFAVYDANGDGTIDSSDMGVVAEMEDEGIPNKPGFVGGKRQYTSTSAGTINDRDINVGGGEREGRLSWEEMTPD
ncbi:pilus assembly protein [Microbulbifer elongatus]|uniref:pilus assembly protein n=1 Tax=Microbulbifer elongatus TaxID=86173 RepID=UPI001E5B8C41|nr:PilC/PilY family type IV pilus protein [Microbulbifer elongatus]